MIMGRRMKGWGLTKKNINSWCVTLRKILKKGELSPLLRTAVENALEAIQAKDYKLACQLTAVKSFICGEINPKDKKNLFQENQKSNESNLGDSVYCILDGVHHNIAFALDDIPSGMMVFGTTSKGHFVVQEFKRKGKHPIIKRMEYEHNQNAK
jgi:hypothetical protein